MSTIPLFTLPLPRFIRYHLAGFDKIEIDECDAIVIMELDKQELYCHIQMPSSENTLSKPLLWNKRAWLEDSERLRKLKERSAAERREANLAYENANRIAKAMMKETGLEYDAVYPIALKIARKKLEVAAETFNVKMEK